MRNWLGTHSHVITCSKCVDISCSRIVSIVNGGPQSDCVALRPNYFVTPRRTPSCCDKRNRQNYEDREEKSRTHALSQIRCGRWYVLTMGVYRLILLSKTRHPAQTKERSIRLCLSYAPSLHLRPGYHEKSIFFFDMHLG